MLHPIKPPNCIAELEKLISLQRKTLEFACTDALFRDADFEAAVGAEFVGWLNSLKHVGGKTSKTANRFIEEIRTFIKCSPAEKMQVLQDFLSDQEFYKRIEDPAFTFSLSPSKSDAHVKARDFLVEFYDFLGIGFPAILVGYATTAPAFKKEDVINGYKTTNPDIEYICPCCDSAFTDSANANEQGYTLEHYFPRSLYPSICLHPLNLIPMCSGCNSRKENIDPLNPSRLPLIHVSYQEVFHPVARPVIRYTDMDFHSRSTVPDAMDFISLTPPLYENSISAYKIMYQIPSRWETNWRRIDHQVGSYLRKAVKRLGVQTIDDRLFDDAIQEAITDLQSDIGQQHFCYPAMKWLNWARVNKFQELKQAFVS